MTAFQAAVVPAIHALCFLLVATGIGRLVILIRGAWRVRKDRLTTPPAPEALIRSSLLPAAAVIAVPPDASPASRLYIRRLLDQRFGSLEVIAVLDGASEPELAIWKEHFHLEESSREPCAGLKTEPVRAVFESRGPTTKLVVIQKDAGGWADCLNAGLNRSTAPLVATAPPEALFSDDALLRLVRPLLASPDQTLAVIAVAPSEPGADWLSRLNAVYSLRIWLGRCAGLSVFNSLLPPSGSFLLAKRSALMSLGGFKATLTETSIHLHGWARAAGIAYRVALLSEPLFQLPPPCSPEDLRRRVRSDQSHFRQALRRYNHLMFGFGVLGWLVLPALYFFRIIRPALEKATLALAILLHIAGVISPALLGLVIAVTLGLGVLVSLTRVLLYEFSLDPACSDQELKALMLTAVTENLGYQQWRMLKAFKAGV